MLRLGIFYDSQITRFERNDTDIKGKVREVSKKYDIALEKRHKSKIGLNICFALEELSLKTQEYVSLLQSIRDTSFRMNSVDLSGLDLS